MGDALDDLIKAVEAGKAGDDIIGAVFSPNDIPSWHINQLAREAYDGSLDAAMRLHEALLPGWVYSIHSAWDNVNIRDPGGDDWQDCTSPHGVARAWLLAILRALQAQSAPLDENGPAVGDLFR